MGWDEVIIGKGPQACTTIKVFEIAGNHGISDNMIFFRCSDVFADAGMTIYKDTKEGKTLIKMIEDNKSLIKINKYLQKIFIKRVNPNLLISYIEKIRNEAYQLGKQQQQEILRDALGIRNY